MKKFWVIFLTMSITSHVAASSLECERIRDSDQRNLCRAETTGRRTWCAYIKDSDLRARCYAVTGSKR